MAVVPAVVTNVARFNWPRMFGSLQTFASIAYFKVGQGGWVNPGTGAVPRTPDPSLTDLDIIVNPSRYAGSLPVGATGWFQKTLTGAAFAFEAPTTLVITCLLDFGDYNADPISNPTAYPNIWEIGAYDQNGVMVAYGTFAAQTKNSSKQLENVIRITF